MIHIESIWENNGAAACGDLEEGCHRQTRTELATATWLLALMVSSPLQHRKMWAYIYISNWHSKICTQRNPKCWVGRLFRRLLRVCCDLAATSLRAATGQFGHSLERGVSEFNDSQQCSSTYLLHFFGRRPAPVSQRWYAFHSPKGYEIGNTRCELEQGPYRHSVASNVFCALPFLSRFENIIILSFMGPKIVFCC